MTGIRCHRLISLQQPGTPPLGRLHNNQDYGDIKMKARTLVAIVLVPIFITLSACGAWWLPRAHRIDIQQGNLLSTEQISQVAVGMSKTQVTSLLGRPLTTNQLNPDRWEYIYSLNRSGETPEVQRLSLEFENDQVANLEKDGFPEDDE